MNLDSWNRVSRSWGDDLLKEQIVDNKNSNEKFGTKADSWGNDNDPFEEFEFKPLTEGLGFHAKNQANKKAIDAGMTMGTTTKFSTEKKRRQPRHLD